MIPYPHDTTDLSPTVETEPVEAEPVIGPSAFLDGRRPGPRRGFVAGSCLVAILLHAYAFSILPAAMEMDFEEQQVIEANLEIDEISIDPDLPIHYNGTRIEEISVPGPIAPIEAETLLERNENRGCRELRR